MRGCVRGLFGACSGCVQVVCSGCVFGVCVVMRACPIIQPIYVNNGTERQTKFYKADFFTNTLDMTP